MSIIAQEGTAPKSCAREVLWTGQGAGRRIDLGQVQLDRTAFAVGLEDRLEERNDVAAVGARDERGPVFDDGSEEVADLERMVLVCHVDGLESRAVFGLKAFEDLLLAGDRPQVVERRLGDTAETPAMKVAPRSVSTPIEAPDDAVNVHFCINSRFLGQAGDDRAQAALAEAEDGDGGILDLDGGVVQVSPVPADLVYLVAHQPCEQVEHMGRLVDEHAAAFGIPAAAPGIRAVVGWVAPAIHGERAQHRPADFARVDCVFHAFDRLVPAALADDAELVWCSLAAASIASQSERLAASGFSTSTWVPARAAVIVAAA